jgi:hypothetical protein
MNRCALKKANFNIGLKMLITLYNILIIISIVASIFVNEPSIAIQLLVIAIFFKILFFKDE